MWPGSRGPNGVALALSSDTGENLNPEKSEDDETRWRSAARVRSKSNQRILIFTCAAFFIYVVSEYVGASISGSLSLLGDAAAMSVDVFTYLCNIYAERYKMRNEIMSRRTNIILEIMIPSFSVLCLLGVTGYVAVDAVHVVMAGAADTREVNLYYLYGYSVAGAVIDIVSSIFFFKDGTGTEVFFTNGTKLVSPVISTTSNVMLAEETRIASLEDAPQTTRKVNLNMMSAFTHLTGDSMRTAAVIIAAMVSSIGGYPSQICDAYAALVITGTILIMTIPLITEIFRAYVKLTKEPDLLV